MEFGRPKFSRKGKTLLDGCEDGLDEIDDNGKIKRKEKPGAT